jgi:hypothetical protein
MAGSGAYNFGAGAGGGDVPTDGGSSSGFGGQGMSMLSKAVSSLLKNYNGSTSQSGSQVGGQSTPLSGFGMGGSQQNTNKITWQEELARLQELIKGEEGKDDGI